MQTLKRAVAAVIAILFILAFIGHALTGRGQSNTPAASVVDTILQPVAPDNVPTSAAFFLLSDYLNSATKPDDAGPMLGPP